jgi:hypothetical protein
VYPYYIESLQQFPTETYNPNLVLLSEQAHITITDEQSGKYFNYVYYTDTEYIIKSENGSHVQTIGITSNFGSEYDCGFPSSLEFFVDSKKREYTATLNRNYTDETHFYLEYQLTIDVSFPEGIPVSVRVVYDNYLISEHDETRKNILCGTNSFYKERSYTWNNNAEYVLLLENRSHNFFWVSDIIIGNKINLLDIDLFKAGIEYTIIDDHTTKLCLTSVIQNENNNKIHLKILLSSIFYAFSDGSLQFDFIPHDADGTPVSQEILKPYKLLLLTTGQLRILRNAFYAQYGYVFQDLELQKLFKIKPDLADRPILNAKSSAFNESLFNQIERENIRIIRDLETLKTDVLSR